MKREIKFRAWNGEEMFEVGAAHLTDTAGSQTFKAWDGERHDYLDLMQFTGLKDKNGKEIYEGDVLRCEDLVTVVEWDEEFSGWALSQETPKKGKSISLNVVTISEVIGNIYENPDLLHD